MPKVVKREVIGSANPVAKFFRELSNSIKGIATGILFIIGSFILIGVTANQKEHSKVIEALPLQTPEEVEGFDGMVKIQGEPDYSNTVVAPNTDEEVLYYSMRTEEFAVREVEKTRTVTENGQEIRETYVEYETKWETVDTETKWSDFALGNIEINNPGKATLRVDTEEFYTNTEDLEYNEFLSQEELVDVPQKRRVTVTGVPADSTLIVVGANSGDSIASGEEGTYFISNKNEADFLASQQSSERTKFWILIGVTWFLMTSGFTMLLGPITKILDIIPGVGGLVNGLLFIVFGIVSAVIIFIAYIGIKFWWLILLILIALIGFIVYKKAKKGDIKHIETKGKKAVVMEKKDNEFEDSESEE